MDLTEATCRLASQLPERERFGLWSQLTRASSSIPANIAGDHGRQGRREFANFVSIARGSLAELETFVRLAERLGYARPEETAPLKDLAGEVGRLTTRLHQSLRSSS